MVKNSFIFISWFYNFWSDTRPYEVASSMAHAYIWCISFDNWGLSHHAQERTRWGRTQSYASLSTTCTRTGRKNRVPSWMSVLKGCEGFWQTSRTFHVKEVTRARQNEFLREYFKSWDHGSYYSLHEFKCRKFKLNWKRSKWKPLTN